MAQCSTFSSNFREKQEVNVDNESAEDEAVFSLAP